MKHRHAAWRTWVAADEELAPENLATTAAAEYTDGGKKKVDLDSTLT